MVTWGPPATERWEKPDKAKTSKPGVTPPSFSSTHTSVSAGQNTLADLTEDHRPPELVFNLQQTHCYGCVQNRTLTQ